jgi:predicted PurR-regulated permease PerM
MGWAKSFFDPPVRAWAGWWLFAGLLTAVLLVILSPYLGWAIFGIFLYYVARPITRQVRQQGVSSTSAAALTVGLFIVPLVALLLALTAYVVWQVATLEPTDIESVLEVLFPDIDLEELPASPDAIYALTDGFRTDPTVESALLWLSGFIGTFVSQLYNALLTILFVFFLLRDEQSIKDWVYENILEGRPNLIEYIQTVDQGLKSIYFGYTLTLLAITVFAAIIYHTLNLIAPSGLAIPHPMLLAIATGLTSVIPLVGRNLLYGAVIVYLSALAFRSDPTLLWFPGLFFLVMNLAFDNIIRIYVRPSLSGRLFPIGLVMFAYLLGPPIFGWYGIFLGPFVMVVVVQFLRYRLPFLLHPNS